MATSHWEDVQALFHAAGDLDECARCAFLDQSCGSDTQLRREVEGLLAALGGADDFLDSSLGDASADLFGYNRPERIGPYSIVRVLGEGGMGTVYLATRCDDEYRKQVAIKLIRHGCAAPDAIRRFRSERQILADLDHPAIARLLDGGRAPSGLPYLVMEYVEGVDIDDFCRDNRLSIGARLELFQIVCAAVAHAHRHLIVHRDIKPSNILVTRGAEPKLLDFGVARLLSPDKSNVTVTDRAERALTLAYASPEQIRGEPITTAADVYSLGMTLYQLLTGVQPFDLDSKSPAECERLVCETMPVRPSAAGNGNPELAGDLDSIVLQAIRKEAVRRYSSVDSLNEDIQRYLTGMPVRAQPDTWRYRANKFVRRHRGGAAMAGSILLILLTAIVLVLSAQRRAQTARLQAQHRFQTVLAMANSSLFEIDSAIAAHRGTTQERSMVVRRALQYLNSLAKGATHDRELDGELADAYEKLSDIQFHDGPGSLGDSLGALANSRMALRLRESLASSDGATQNQGAVAEDLMRVAALEGLTGSVSQGTADYRQARHMYESLATRSPEDRSLRSHLAEAYLQTANLERIQESHLPDARRDLEKGLELRETLLARAPGEERSLHGMEEASVFAFDLEFQQTGDLVRALEHLQRALALARTLAARYPDNLEYKTDLASILLRAGLIHSKLREPAKALGFFRESRSRFDALAASDPTDAKFRRDQAIVRNGLALALIQLGRPREAESLYRESLSILQGLTQDYPQHRDTQFDLAGAQTSLGSLLVRGGRFSEGFAELKTSVASREKLIAADPQNLRWRSALAVTYVDLGRAWEKVRAWQDAISAYTRAGQILNGLQGKIDTTGAPDDIARDIARCKDASARQ